MTPLRRISAGAAGVLIGLGCLAAPDTSAAATSADRSSRQVAAHRADPPRPVVRALLAALRQRQARAPATRHVCYQAHVQNIGWQNYVACDGAVAGTTGRSLRMEALAIATSNVGGLCAAGHVQNIGWQPSSCAADGQTVTVGTTGRSLRLEAVTLRPRTGSVCANAHVQNIGWQGTVCGGTVTVGTTGRSLRMEAITIRV
jgi:uncharacterized protein YjdB